MKTRLPALEKNILVFRALQMALFLYYAESVRKRLVDTVGTKIRKKTKQEIKGAKFLKAIFSTLTEEMILTPAEAKDLQELIEHRNTIAHDIYRLTGDIETPGRKYGFHQHFGLKYDYRALERIKKWNSAIWDKLGSTYILTIGLDGALFEAAETAYLHEIAALRKRIDRQYEARVQKIKKGA
jgi:hypothetical protein